MATHSSVLAWTIPGTGEPGGLPSMGSHRVGHDWSDLAAAAAAYIHFNLISLKSYYVLRFEYSDFKILLKNNLYPNQLKNWHRHIRF